MARLNLSTKDLSKWLKVKRQGKETPLQEMTESEIKEALATFKLDRQNLMKLTRATEFDEKKAPTVVESRRLDGGMNQTPNPQKDIYGG